MCTILAFYQMHPEYPLIIAANRDEFLRRKSTPPQVLVEEPRVLGGLDVESQGTWMGATPSGFFVGLTNQRTYQKSNPELQSRGPLVVNALQQEDPASTVQWLKSLDGRKYNPFNLLFGNADSLWVAYARAEHEEIRVEEVQPGFHILPNTTLNAEDSLKAQHVRTVVEDSILRGFAEEKWDAISSSLQHILQDHQKPPLSKIPKPPSHSVMPRLLIQQLEALCVKVPGYGTCSSTIFGMGKSQLTHYLFSPGSPRQTPFEDFTHLL